jgi:hypothetical protein
MEHAGATVGRFEPASQLPIVQVERHSEIHQVGDARWAFRTEHFDRIWITEAGARTQGVSDVRSHAVIRKDRGCNPTLGEARVAVFQSRLGHQGDGMPAAQPQRGNQAGDPAPYDDNVLDGSAHFERSAVELGVSINIRSSAMRAGFATSSGTVMRLRISPRSSPSRTQAR